ncbi:MAG: hypothetical protein ACI8UD_000566 [Planctomycetota bacterium]|jgi:hypothetical protein
MERPVRPLDFVGIGAAKSGTTWISQCLGEHSDICVPRLKELDYFCEFSQSVPMQGQLGRSRYHLGNTWLQRQFEDATPQQICGEYSPRYLVDSESPRLLFEHNPQIKLIVALRHPVDRLYSFYFQLKQDRILPGSFEGFLKQHPHLIAQGFYCEHLARFLKFFPVENIYAVLYEDILADPMAVMQGLCAFLGVNDEFRPPSLQSRVNAAQQPRSQLLVSLLERGRSWMRTIPSVNAARVRLNRLGANKLERWLIRMNLREGKNPVMQPDTRRWLVEQYQDHNTQLGEFLQRDMSHWNR